MVLWDLENQLIHLQHVQFEPALLLEMHLSMTLIKRGPFVVRHKLGQLVIAA